jgi:hypothetical protein
MQHTHPHESAAQPATLIPGTVTYGPALDLATEFIRAELQEAWRIFEGNEALFGVDDETPGLMEEAHAALDRATRATADERPRLVAVAAGLLQGAIAVARHPVPAISTGRNRALRQTQAASQRERFLLVARVTNALLQVHE